MDQDTSEHSAFAVHRDPSVDRALRRSTPRAARAGYGIEWVAPAELGTRVSTGVIALGARVNRAAATRARSAIADRARKLAPLRAFGKANRDERSQGLSI